MKSLSKRFKNEANVAQFFCENDNRLMTSIFPVEDDESELLQDSWREKLRQRLVPGSRFDKCMLACIIGNSILTACVDYSILDENFEPVTQGSARNYIIEVCETVFLFIFFVECSLKIIAMGLFRDKGSYLRDGWNVFDFMIVMISIVSVVPVIPNLTAIRSLRVLRPLRSISKLPGLRKILEALITSTSELFNVILLLIFLLICFSMTGMFMWKGLMHGRCRKTPFPIVMPSDCNSTQDDCWDKYLTTAIMQPLNFRCTMEDNDSLKWNQQSSPWFQFGPFDCIWPLDETDKRLCDTGAHFRLCSPENTCGSDYDAFGNPRFINTIKPYGIPRMDIALYEESLNWGLTGFDSFPQAMITIFQIITLEGWSAIFDQITDVWHKPPTFVFFCFQIVLCGYIVLNLVLAIISKSLDNIGKKIGDSFREETNQVGTFPVEMKETHLASRYAETEYNGLKRLLRSYVGTKAHSTVIMTCIFLNSIVLSMDYYGISQNQAATLDYLNLAFAVIFLADVIICIIHFGLRIYWRNSIRCFDGVLGFLSLVEIVIYAMPRTMSGSFAAFRALRLFRLLKLARNWKSLQNLLRTIIITLPEIANFGALLMIIIFVFSLVGMQLLAGRLRFDPGTIGLPFSTKRNETVEVPRANFDNMYWSIITVFQILTGEDWNRIMYDGWRVQGSSAVLFVTLVMTVGNFVVMNLFLAILLKHFEERSNIDERQPETDECLLAHTEVSTEQEPISRLHRSFMEKDHVFRKICYRVVESWKFDALVTLLIVFSSICLLLDNPLADPAADFIKNLHCIEFWVTIFFIFEALAKILGYGLIADTNSYLRSGWNILDFSLVIVSILSMKNIGPGNVLRPLRTLRVLRPLRMIRRFKELKVVVDALMSSIPAVTDVGILCLLTFLIFSCFGVSFLKGTFYRCGGNGATSFVDYEVSIMTHPEKLSTLSKLERDLFRAYHLECEYLWYDKKIPTSKEVCLCLGGSWVPVVPQNFDNVLKGIALLFEISTTEGWVQVMYAAIDQRGVHMEPVRDHSPIWALFFVIFILICGFFLLELFVGVVLENFSRIRQKSGSGLMTESQRIWARTQAFLLKIRPIRSFVRPSHSLRSKIYDITYGTGASKFEFFVTCCICITVINLSLSSFGDSQMKVQLISSINSVFVVIFGLEVALKLIAIGWYYFDDRWNCFDFLVAAVTITGLFFDEKVVAVTPLRLARLFHFLRLLKNVEKLRQLFNTLVVSIPSIANIGGLILLIFFIYAILGVQLFCFLPENGELTNDLNFRSFGNACLLLFRFATGENWNGFMRNMMVSVDNCQDTQIFNPDMPWCLKEDDHPNCTPLLGCGAGISAYLYFYSFVIAVSFVILNLFVGVVLEAFENSAEGGDLSPNDLDEFIRAWSIFDSKASGFIPAMSMKKLVMELSPPLGIGDRTNYKKAQEVMNHECLKDLPITKDGKVNIVHAATQLAKRVTMEKVGDAFVDLSDDHPLQRRWRATIKDSDQTLNQFYMEKSKKKLRVLRAFARAKIKPEDLFASSV